MASSVMHRSVFGPFYISFTLMTFLLFCNIILCFCMLMTSCLNLKFPERIPHFLTSITAKNDITTSVPLTWCSSLWLTAITWLGDVRSRRAFRGQTKLLLNWIDPNVNQKLIILCKIRFLSLRFQNSKVRKNIELIFQATQNDSI